jgi:L-fuconolactonase
MSWIPDADAVKPFSPSPTTRASEGGLAGATRRDFIRTSGTIAAAAMAGISGTAMSSDSEVIDCHTHFYDPGRPQGVPWPDVSDRTLYRAVYPRDYRTLAAPLGITGTVVVEASAWAEDNDWILDLARDETVIRGFVGRLSPGEPSFAAEIRRLTRNELFRGIRVSGDDVNGLTESGRLRDLAILAEHDLSLDVNGAVSSLPAVAAIARAVPSLRIVIDHVANVAIDGGIPPADWLKGMEAAAKGPHVYCKVSGLVEGTGRRNGQAPAAVGFYRPVIDAVWNRFGEERLIFGSNWPVSEGFAPLPTVQRIVSEYFHARGDRASRRYFAENARTAYKWLARA